MIHLAALILALLLLPFAADARDDVYKWPPSEGAESHVVEITTNPGTPLEYTAVLGITTGTRWIVTDAERIGCLPCCE
jgi:hypothetical protein